MGERGRWGYMYIPSCPHACIGPTNSQGRALERGRKGEKRKQAVLDEKVTAAVVVVIVAHILRVHSVGGRGRSVDMLGMRGAGCSARRGNYMGAERRSREGDEHVWTALYTKAECVRSAFRV